MKKAKLLFSFFLILFIYAIQGKFITWLVNSALNCTRKPISHSSLRDSCDIGFRVQFNAEFTSQVMNFPILDDMIDHRSYTRNSTNCEIKALKRDPSPADRAEKRLRMCRLWAVGGSSAGKSRLEQQISNVKSIAERWRYFVDFLHDFESFSFPKRFIYLRGIALVVLIAETFERQGVLFILLTLYCA